MNSQKNLHYLFVISLVIGYLLIINTLYSQNKHPYASNKPMHEPKKFEIQGVNSAWHITFEPDGNTFYFVTGDSGIDMELIKYCTFAKGKWSKPKLAEFSGKYRIETPSISPDGKKFFFAKAMVVNGQGTDDIYVMDKTASGWSEPKEIGSPINSPGFDASPSCAANGNLYFFSDREGGIHIFCSRFINGAYTVPVALDDNINRFNVGELCVAPDETYILFNINTPPNSFQLYVSFNQNGSWTAPYNLGPKINLNGYQGRPCISPDGKYLFYSSGNPENWNMSQYQVDIKPLLDSVKNAHVVNAMIEQNINPEVKTLITLKEKAGKIKFSKTPSWLKPYAITSGNEQKITNKINLKGLNAGTYRAQVNLKTEKDPDKEYTYSVILNLFEPSHAVTKKNLQKGIKYEYYEDTSFTIIPDFTKMKPQKTGIAKNLDLSVKNRDTLFAVVYNGFINIPQTALYKFYMTSDDGSKLYIDDKLYINNDGLHAPSEKCEICCLEKGLHKIKVEYMQGRQGYSLELSYENAEAGIEKKVFSENELFY